MADSGPPRESTRADHFQRTLVSGGVPIAAILVRDRADARAFFERDRPWAAWALSSLGTDDWPYARLWVDDTTSVALWTFDHPLWGGAVTTFGADAALDALIRTAALPRRAFVKALPPARPALAARYRFEWLDPIMRMAVTADTFRPAVDAPQSEPLGAEHGEELARLYAGWPESRFHVGRLRHGYWYEGIRESGCQDERERGHQGVRGSGHESGQLVAVAENGIRSIEEGVAVVQGVYVHPRWRGRGLARAVTAALTARLLAAGARDVVLDVRAENAAARVAYERLGYRVHARFLGGPAGPHIPNTGR